MMSVMNEHNQQEVTTLEAFLVQAMQERRLSIVALTRVRAAIIGGDHILARSELSEAGY